MNTRSGIEKLEGSNQSDWYNWWFTDHKEQKLKTKTKPQQILESTNALGEDYVSDHLDRIKDTYQRFQTYFIALTIFSLFFMSAILLPYIFSVNERYWLEQENETETSHKDCFNISWMLTNKHKIELIRNFRGRTSSNIKSVTLSQEFNGRPLNLSNTSGNSLDPRTASFGDNVNTVWEDNVLGSQINLSSNLLKVIFTLTVTIINIGNNFT